MAQILCVDDERLARALVERALTPQHEVVGAQNSADAREALASQLFDLVLLDVNMPGESGTNLLSELTRTSEGPGVIMVTAEDSPALAKVAVEMGAYGYLVKPFQANELEIAVTTAIRRHELEQLHREREAELKQLVELRTASLRESTARAIRSEQLVRDIQADMIRRLSIALDHRDRHTGGHAERVGTYSALLAKHAGVRGERCAMLRLAAPLHDVGKIGIPDAILQKPGALTDEERAVMQTHTTIGHELLSDSAHEVVQLAAEIALHHHEYVDGSGYPHGLTADAISLDCRIVAIADVFDALTSTRPYRDAHPVSEALTIMRNEAGSHLDADLLDHFLGLLTGHEGAATLEALVTVAEAAAGVEPGRYGHWAA